MGKITNAGLALMANAIANQTLFKIKWMGLGDENKETYSGSETTMTDMRWHNVLERIYIEPGSSNIVRFEGLYWPTDDRGWPIKEVALFAEDSDYPGDFDHAILFWIAQHPDSYIPEAGDTVVSEVITVPIEFTDATIAHLDVTLALSDAALATVRDLMQMTLASVSYTTYRDLENAEMIGLIRAKIART
ncbi:phage tail protein [bacterium]|nr:phage tail protein [bacterium]